MSKADLYPVSMTQTLNSGTSADVCACCSNPSEIGFNGGCLPQTTLFSLRAFFAVGFSSTLTPSCWCCRFLNTDSSGQPHSFTASIVCATNE